LPCGSPGGIGIVGLPVALWTKLAEEWLVASSIVK
jgi:hypothetical protein